MNPRLSSAPPIDAAGLRLAALADLDEEDLAAIRRATAVTRRVLAHRELVAEGRPVTEPMIVVRGFAARIRLFADGRRQILNFLLPGDLIGVCRQARPVAATTVVALTELNTCR